MKEGFAKLILKERRRFIKFCIVGTSGIFVNLLFVTLGNEVFFSALKEEIKTPISYALGIVVSIFTNFLLNDLWTWADRKGRKSFTTRMFQYYVVSAIAAVVQFGVSNSSAFLIKYMFFPHQPSLHTSWKLASALAGIAMGTIINFIVNHLWTFKSTKSPSPE